MSIFAYLQHFAVAFALVAIAMCVARKHISKRALLNLAAFGLLGAGVTLGAGNAGADTQPTKPTGDLIVAGQRFAQNVQSGNINGAINTGVNDLNALAAANNLPLIPVAPTTTPQTMNVAPVSTEPTAPSAPVVTTPAPAAPPAPGVVAFGTDPAADTLPEHFQNLVRPTLEKVYQVTVHPSMFIDQVAFEPTDPMTQLGQTVDLVKPDLVLADESACGIEGATFNQKTACAAAIEDKYNGPAPATPVIVTKSLTPPLVFGFENGELCGQMPLATNHCEGVTHLSQPAMNAMASPTGHNDREATQAQIAYTVFHEGGHKLQDIELQAAGSSFGEFEKAHGGSFLLEQGADKSSAYIGTCAILNGELPASSYEEGIAPIVGTASEVHETTHGSQAERRAAFDSGRANALASGCNPLFTPVYGV